MQSMTSLPAVNAEHAMTVHNTYRAQLTTHSICKNWLYYPHYMQKIASPPTTCTIQVEHDLTTHNTCRLLLESPLTSQPTIWFGSLQYMQNMTLPPTITAEDYFITYDTYEPQPDYPQYMQTTTWLPTVHAQQDSPQYTQNTTWIPTIHTGPN